MPLELNEMTLSTSIKEDLAKRKEVQKQIEFVMSA